MDTELLHSIKSYFADTIRRHGSAPAGVDWNGDDAQTIRFKILCKVITRADGFSINDLGCGYGRLAQYLYRLFPKCRYYGYDILQEMIDAAVTCEYRLKTQFSTIVSAAQMRVSDYTLASGIFNIKPDCTDAAWQKFIEKTIDDMDRKSKQGFAFNMLTAYSDSNYMKQGLFYGDPCYFFDYCKTRFSKNVSLIHDYDLYDFTILVRKESMG